MRKGIIYVCVNLFDGRRYIGQTKTKFETRKKKHLQSMKTSEAYFYRALRKFGEENFVWSIIESDIEENMLDEREKYYIEKYKTYDSKNGYNMTKGGEQTHNSKLTNEEVELIKNYLKTTELSALEIAEKLGGKINRSTVSDINCGDTYFSPKETYPLRLTKYSRNLTKEEIFEIYNLLKTGIEFSKIAEIYAVSVTTISNINKGLIHKFLKENEYPIVNLKFVHMNKNLVINIVTMLKNTNFSQQEIANTLGTRRENVKNINNGNHHKDILQELGIKNFPIRETESEEDKNKRILNIANSLKNTNDKVTKIAKDNKTNVSTVRNINRGKSFKDLLVNSGFDFPIRKVN